MRYLHAHVMNTQITKSEWNVLKLTCEMCDKLRDSVDVDVVLELSHAVPIILTSSKAFAIPNMSAARDNATAATVSADNPESSKSVKRRRPTELDPARLEEFKEAEHRKGVVR